MLLILVVVDVIVIGGGNLYWRFLASEPASSFSISCERDVCLLDKAVSAQYGKGAWRVLDWRKDAAVSEEQVNEICYAGEWPCNI